MNFCSDKRLDSIFSLLSDPVVHCERVASVQTPSISRAGGCWSHHQANTQNTNIMQTEKLLHVPREMPSQAIITTDRGQGFTRRPAGMASVWYSGVALEAGESHTRPHRRLAHELLTKQSCIAGGGTTAGPLPLCSCSEYYLQMCLQYTLVLAAGVARDCQPGRRGPSISRDIISGADTLTSRGHTRDTWPHT